LAYGDGTYELIGAARAELKRRQLEYESERDKRREDHDFKMLEGRGRLNAVQQDFTERLAREQMAHAERLAKEQLIPAANVARATKWAALAAAASALAAVISVAFSVANYFHHS
jgi:DNA helicase IV